MLAGPAAEDDGDAGLAGGLVHRPRPYRPTLADMADDPLTRTPARPALRPARSPSRPAGRDTSRTRRSTRPITMASTYVAGGDLEYGRYGNPTWTAFEDALGALEGGRCLAFASGLAAVATVLDLVGHGAKVVAPAARLQRHDHAARRPRGPRPAHGRAGRHHRHRRRRRGLRRRRAGLAGVADQPGPRGRRHPDDHRRRARGRRLRRRRQHLRHSPAPDARSSDGVDLVVHSATKYLAGHSDVLLGAIVTRDDELYAVLKGRRDLLGADPRHRSRRGWRCAACAPCTCASSAPRPTPQELVRRLAEHPARRRGPLPRLRRRSSSIVLAQGAMAADLLTHKTTLWVHATSLGGVESTFERRRRWKTEAADHPRGPGPALRRHRGRRGPLGRPAHARSDCAGDESAAAPARRSLERQSRLGLGVAGDEGVHHLQRGHPAVDDRVDVLGDRGVDAGAARRGRAATRRTWRPRRPGGSRRRSPRWSCPGRASRRRCGCATAARSRWRRGRRGRRGPSGSAGWRPAPSRAGRSRRGRG